MKILSGSFDFSSNALKYDSQEIDLFDCEDYTIMKLGDIQTDKNTFDFNYIINLYQQHHNHITEKINGLYILVICDKKNGSINIYQDRNTSPWTLYYCSNENILYFSTSLKKLLLDSNIIRKLNDEVIEEFLINGYIYGPETLIKDIYKIHICSCLNASENNIVQNHVEYSTAFYTEQQSKDQYKQILDQAILKQVKADVNEINTALSGGYDSNYIIHVLNHEASLPINAFSIGANIGTNEIPKVKKIIKHYPNLSFYSDYVNVESFNSLPDIVYRLEGSVFEAGIFLQYELFKLMSRLNKKTMICGECADQVFNQNYYDEDKILFIKDSKTVKYDFFTYPFLIASLVVLKKNSIMANSFDIETRYPYLDDTFVSLCRPLGSYNNYKKRIHVENCYKTLSPEIMRIITKKGGTTESRCLFDGKSSIEKFYNIIEQTSFYKDHQKIFNPHENKTFLAPSYNFIKKIYNTFIRRNLLYIKSFLKKKLHLFVNDTIPISNEERKLREYICCAYIILFQKIFISKEYDHLFMNDSIQIDDFLSHL